MAITKEDAEQIEKVLNGVYQDAWRSYHSAEDWRTQKEVASWIRKIGEALKGLEED